MRAMFSAALSASLLALSALSAPAGAIDDPVAEACNEPGAVSETPSGLCVPRYVSLKFDVANGRAGPSRDHPIRWRYVRSGLPMEIVAETPDWRRVRDPEGELTWMSRTLLSGRRTVFALAETELRARADADAPVAAVAEAGAVMDLERCRDGWCRLEAQGRRGWAQTDTLWGVYEHEREGGGAPAQEEELGPAMADSSDALSGPPARDTASR